MELLRVEHLDKTFGSQQALADISFDLRTGEVHALVGENGAGKSTFIKILTGVYSKNRGSIMWKGSRAEISSPKAARRLGIYAVHQDRNLIPSFTGYENLYLGLDYPAFAFGTGIRWRKMREQAEQAAAELGISLPLDKPAADMTPPEKTMLEIVRAAMLDCALLILDEPTAALTDQEAEKLFALIRRLASQGTAILYVSHRLEEIFRIADRITVFRNGRSVCTAQAAETNQDELIQWMSGVSVQAERRERRRTGETLLEVERLATADGRVRNVNLKVRKGEIAGIFGLAGAGRTELLEAIYGLRPVVSGRMLLEGQPVVSRSPRESLDRGVVLIPEERKRDGLILSMSLRENMTLSVIDRFRRWLGMDRRAERSTAEQWMQRMSVKAAGVEQPAGELSGGNQQKVVFAKALMSEPKLFLCDEPTQAVDVVTRGEIHRLLREQAEKGSGILLVTSDLQEMLEIADRLYILREGEIVAELENDSLTPEQVLQLCFHPLKGGNQ